MNPSVIELANKFAMQMLDRRRAMIREAYTSSDPVRRIELHFALGSPALACGLLAAYNKTHPGAPLAMSQFMGSTN